jgi:hypothetical protein
MQCRENTKKCQKKVDMHVRLNWCAFQKRIWAGDRYPNPIDKFLKWFTSSDGTTITWTCLWPFRGGIQNEAISRTCVQHFHQERRMCVAILVAVNHRGICAAKKQVGDTPNWHKDQTVLQEPTIEGGNWKQRNGLHFKVRMCTNLKDIYVPHASPCRHDS